MQELYEAVPERALMFPPEERARNVCVLDCIIVRMLLVPAS